MATLIDRIRIWASGGATATPTDAKIDLGWVGGEQPTHEWENDRMNVRDTTLVGCVDAVNDTPAGGRMLFKNGNVAAGILESIGLPYSADNYYDSGDAKIDASCLYEYEGVKKVFFSWTPSSGTKVIKSIDVNTGVGLSYLFTVDLIVDMCSTGRYIYVLYANLDGTDYEYFLTALDGGTWTAKPGWSIPQVGAEPSATVDERPFCCVTPLGNILCGGRWDGTSGDDPLALVDADDGTILDSGDGGLLSSTYQPSGDCIVVDGSMVYTGFWTVDGSEFVGVVDESDLSVAGGGTSTFWTPSGMAVVSGQHLTVASLGDYFVAGYPGSTNYELEMTNKDNSESWPVVDIAGANTVIGSMTFDGVNLWLLLFVDDGAGITGMLVRRFNPQSLSENLTDVGIDTSEDTDKNHFLALAGTSTELGQCRPGMVFDGAGLWVTPYASTGNDFSGEWFRISNVYNR